MGSAVRLWEAGASNSLQGAVCIGTATMEMVRVEPACDPADHHEHSPERLSQQDTEASLHITMN